MRRRWIRFLLGILYVGLLTALLITHILQITAQTQRLLALAETLLLAVPLVGVLVFYIRMREPEEESAMPVQAKEITSMEQLKERMGDFSLTEREWEIAWLVYRGYTNRQIAEEYCIAESTVKKHVTHIYEKLRVSKRSEFKDKVRGAGAQKI